MNHSQYDLHKPCIVLTTAYSVGWPNRSQRVTLCTSPLPVLVGCRVQVLDFLKIHSTPPKTTALSHVYYSTCIMLQVNCMSHAYHMIWVGMWQHKLVHLKTSTRFLPTLKEESVKTGKIMLQLGTKIKEHTKTTKVNPCLHNFYYTQYCSLVISEHGLKEDAIHLRIM